ncbi:hypothetical protein P4S68_11455 [Pseudoalteromonas sp. Hal099]
MPLNMPIMLFGLMSQLSVPKLLVRFDLKTQTMQSWQIPSKEGFTLA